MKKIYESGIEKVYTFESIYVIVMERRKRMGGKKENVAGVVAQVRVFKNGGSRAVRLPKIFGFEAGQEVKIKKEGKKVVIEAIKEDQWESLRKLRETGDGFDIDLATVDWGQDVPDAPRFPIGSDRLIHGTTRGVRGDK